MDKVKAKLRRAKKTRSKIKELGVSRLTVHRTPKHIYAQVINEAGKVLAVASTVQTDVKQEVSNGGNITAAELVGKKIAKNANEAGISVVAFDRSGFRYHGRVKALAEAARAGGLKF